MGLFGKKKEEKSAQGKSEHKSGQKTGKQPSEKQLAEKQVETAWERLKDGSVLQRHGGTASTAATGGWTQRERLPAWWCFS